MGNGGVIAGILAQSDCISAFDGSAAECATGDGCLMPNAAIDVRDSDSEFSALVAGGVWDPATAIYTRSYVAGTSGAAELGFQTYYLACGDASLALTGVACDFNANSDSDNNGVISMSNSGPGNQPPPTGNGYNAWGAAAHGLSLPHGDNCFMIDDPDGFT